MNKRKLHYALSLLRKIHYVWLLGLCIFFVFTALISLRHNNQEMVRLRSAVFAADKNNGDTETALTDLRSYVYAHMNTNLSAGRNAVKPPIQLKYQYERLTAANKTAYSATTAKMLSDAETVCAQQVPGPAISQARLDCAKAYAAAHPVTETHISEDLYKFDFASPVWSPDAAGWSMVAAVLFLLLFIIRFASELAIRHELRAGM